MNSYIIDLANTDIILNTYSLVVFLYLLSQNLQGLTLPNSQYLAEVSSNIHEHTSHTIPPHAKFNEHRRVHVTNMDLLSLLLRLRVSISFYHV